MDAFTLTHDGPLAELRRRCGPVLAAPPHDVGPVERALRRAWDRGEVVRLAPARFCLLEEWRSAPPWDRVVLAAVAVGAARGPRHVFTGLTAAHLHGLWTAETPTTLELRARSGGHPGHRPTTGAFASPRGQERLDGRSTSGLSPSVSDPSGVLPRWAPPPVRQRTRARWAAVEEPVVLTVHLSDGAVAGTVRADSLPTVLRTSAACLPLSEALPVLDSAARRDARAAGDVLRSTAVRPPSAAGRERWGRALAHVEPASESAGESLSRGLIVELGFARPTVQRRHHDADGRFVGRTDFWWEEAGIAGEFDGVTKYDVGAHPDEASRRRAIREEKERELALLRVVRALPRWTWSDLREPWRLERVLQEHGVPRAR